MGLLYHLQMLGKNMKHWWKDNWQEKTKVVEENLLQLYFFHQKSLG
jgi:hypothetical protein